MKFIKLIKLLALLVLFLVHFFLLIHFLNIQHESQTREFEALLALAWASWYLSFPVSYPVLALAGLLGGALGGLLGDLLGGLLFPQLEYEFQVVWCVLASLCSCYLQWFILVPKLLVKITGYELQE